MWATSRPKAGAFIHGQGPWLSAAGAKPEIPGSGIQGVFSLISGQNLFGLDF